MQEQMRRREVITLLGGALTWPRAAGAQQAAPVIGFLSSLARVEPDHLLAAFRRGLKETGFQETENLRIEYRYSEGDYGRLPDMAADLVSRRVTVIVAQAPPAALAAKALGLTIPPMLHARADDVIE